MTPKHQTQNRVITLFRNKPGWRFIGSRQETANSRRHLVFVPHA
jgi:hypothetical protein